MHISPNKYDVALTAVGLGIISVNALLFIIYLVLRHCFRDTAQKAIAKKTDRPGWVFMVLLAGSMWIVGSLQSFGVAHFFPHTRWTCACIKYGVQFTAGFVLWQSAVIYRMVRLFTVYTVMARRQLHAVLVIALLLLPFVVFTVVATVTAPVPFTSSVVCVLDRRALIVLYSLLSLYFTVYLFLTARLMAVMGVLKGMRRYIVMTGGAFTFVPLDAVYTFRLGGNQVYKRLVMMMILILVSVQTFTIFGYILIRKKDTKHHPEDDDAEDHSQVKLTPSMEDARPLPPKHDLFVCQERARRRQRKRDKAKDDLQTAMSRFANLFNKTTVEEEVEPDDEVDERVEHYMVPDDYIIYTIPAHTIDDKVSGRKVNFTDFVKTLNKQDRDRVNDSEGVYEVANMYCAVDEGQVEACLKYLQTP